MEREQSGELTRPKLADQMVMLLILRNAVQSAKSIVPNVKNKLSIGIRKSNYKFTIFCYRLQICLHEQRRSEALYRSQVGPTAHTFATDSSHLSPRLRLKFRPDRLTSSGFPELFMKKIKFS